MKKAFTLAEILITLTLVGVVAATSIPSLITSINEDHYKVAAKKAYADMSGVIRQMAQDKGSLDGYIVSYGSFKSEFIKYFNLIKDCGNEACVPQVTVSNIYKTLNGDLADTWMGGEGQFVINDGMFVNIQNNGWASYGLMIIVDVNGYMKPPNVYGKDTFFFQVINDNLLPMGTPGTYFPVAIYCDKSLTSTYQGSACAVKVMTDTNY